MSIFTFHQAEAYLNFLVHQGARQIFQGELGLKKIKYFLKLFGSPQNKLKVIHIAGTAGKGSTCYLISRLLEAHGFKVGLHLSPHLTDVRERFQMNNKIISKKEFIFYLNKIIPFINKVEQSEYKDLSYFEVLVGLAFYIFADKGVNYAVMETGLGGLYDATNISDRKDKIAVLTKIGFDHMEILGETLEEIAFQKAMIINNNSQVVSIKQSKEVGKIIEEVVKKKKSKLYLSNDRLQNNIQLSLIGDYQKENASLALKTVELIALRDGFKVDEEKVRQVFATAHFPGRFDIKRIKGKTVVLDGAHNPLKMDSFTRALKLKYPGKKFHFLIAFKKGKDYQNMLCDLVPLASKITVTSFFVDNQDLIHLSEKPETIEKNLKKIGLRDYQIISQPEEAFKSVLEAKENIIVITGSLYLLGEIYKLIKGK